MRRHLTFSWCGRGSAVEVLAIVLKPEAELVGARELLGTLDGTCTVIP